MKKSEFKNPEAPATKRQTFAVYCMSKVDVRNEELTRWQCSQLIGKMKKVSEQMERAKIVGDFLEEVHSQPSLPFEKKAVRKPAKKKAATDQLKILEEAQRAGKDAMDKVEVIPMVVQQHENMLDDNSPVVKQWDVPQGVCGFAWVVVKCKGKGVRFVNALKKAGLAGGENSHCSFSRSSYHKGFYHHIHEGGQSYQLKTAYAHAFAEVLSKYEIPCYSGSRLD